MSLITEYSNQYCRIIFFFQCRPSAHLVHCSNIIVLTIKIVHNNTVSFKVNTVYQIPLLTCPRVVYYLELSGNLSNLSGVMSK